jgi:pyruvate dehydrogenase E2 component (dihydrolipoamide acetyltransferase)
MGEFRMPSLGADMDAGTVVEWRVGVGDRVARGDIIALVETEKGLIEVEIFDAGIVESLLVAPGTKVPVGTVLAMIRGDDARAAPAPPATTEQQRPTEQQGPPPAPAPSAPPVSLAPPEVTPATRLRVSPLARRLAEKLGVELSAISGTGVAGAITKADVERAAALAAPAAAGPVARPAESAAPDRVSAMRKAIAAAMARSKREIPHYYLGAQIDMLRAMTWLAEENAKRPVTSRLLHSVLLLRAVALATREVPETNGFWVDGAFQPAGCVHVGVAISLRQGGLVAPAIHDVDRKSLDEIMRELLDLVKRARSGVLRSSEVSEATITVTNLGDQGAETVFGVIYPPQVALVGFGRILERPWAAEGMLGVRPVITASLAADHRASDGHRGGRFLAVIDELLQQPEKL